MFMSCTFSCPRTVPLGPFLCSALAVVGTRDLLFESEMVMLWVNLARMVAERIYSTAKEEQDGLFPASLMIMGVLFLPCPPVLCRRCREESGETPEVLVYGNYVIEEAGGREDKKAENRNCPWVSDPWDWTLAKLACACEAGALVILPEP